MVIVAVHCDAVREKAVFEKRLAAVSPERRRKVMAQKSPEDKRRSLCAALALDACLRVVGLRECEQTYITEPHGRPSLAAHPEWYFSLSHSASIGTVLSIASLTVTLPRRCANVWLASKRI